MIYNAGLELSYMERIDREAASFFEGYRVSSVEKNVVRNFHYAIVESQPRAGRRHRRLIVDEPNHPHLNNKPLFYSDTYQTRGGEKTYVYARHVAGPSRFFTALNTLLEAENLREYESREYKAIFNIGADYSERSIVFPYFDESLASEDFRFCRFFFPFGDVAVEFGATFPSTEEELQDVRRHRVLTRKLESPLLGCDLTKTLALGSLLVETHWSAEHISSSVLQSMLEEVARAAVAV